MGSRETPGPRAEGASGLAVAARRGGAGRPSSSTPGPPLGGPGRGPAGPRTPPGGPKWPKEGLSGLQTMLDRSGALKNLLKVYKYVKNGPM